MNMVKFHARCAKGRGRHMSRLVKAAVVALTVLFAGVTVAPVVEAHPASKVTPKKTKGKRGPAAKASPKAAKKLSASALLKKKNAKKKALALKKANAKNVVKKPTPKIPVKAPPKTGS